MKKILIILLILTCILSLSILIFIKFFKNTPSTDEGGTDNEDITSDHEETNGNIDNTTVSTTEESIKVVIIVAPVNYNGTEFNQVKEILTKANFEIEVASKGVSQAKSMSGETTQIDIYISDINYIEYDAIVFIGGPGAHDYFNDNTATSLAKNFYNAGKLTTAICSAPAILANAGILNGKKATCYPDYENYLTSNGATYTKEDVTVDGIIITGNGPDSSRAFGEKVVEILKERLSVTN